MNTRRLSIFASGLLPAMLLFAAGCSKAESTDAPLERNELVIRFFDSIRNGNSEAAAIQGKKIYELDSDNDYVINLVTIQESNRFIRQAQKRLNSGDILGAIEELSAGRKLYPANTALRRMHARLRQLRNAPRLFEAMRRAGSPASMTAALTAAMTGLSDNLSPELTAYFREYEQRIAQLEQAEKSRQPAGTGTEPEVDPKSVSSPTAKTGA